MDWAESAYGIGFDPLVDLVDFLVGQSGIGFGDGQELSIVPHSKSIIAEQGSSFAVASLCIKQDHVGGPWV